MAPVMCSCIVSLLYTTYLFMAYEESGIHQAQENENRFWTIFALLFSTALFFAQDSPIAFGRWSPSLGFVAVVLSGYVMHLWDRYVHRVAISRYVQSESQTWSCQEGVTPIMMIASNLVILPFCRFVFRQTSLRRSSTGSSSLARLKDLGISVEDQLAKINACLRDIDQLLIPSTINNFLNKRFVLRKEREIISIFEDVDARALNHLVHHVKLGLLFYKVKDHTTFAGQNRTQLIQLLAVDRLPILTVMSRVIVLHALQLLKLRANPRAEYWVRNIILNTHQDDLSDLKTLTDAKGDYFCMNKLIYDDIRSETTRQDIIRHIRKEAAVQQAHMQMGTKKAKERQLKAWRKVLSDVDDTLYCSGGSYPAGVDKRFGKKVVYPGVLAFYRELDLGTRGPEEWPDNRVGNLVFLSARPHVYKDMSEKANFSKFEQLRLTGEDGRKGMHTTPALLTGDLTSGSQYIVSNDFEPLASKKFDNFQRYVSIYPEFSHVFVCDNGQGDVRAGEMMFDAFPYEFEALYVHVVQDISKTYGYNPDRWAQKEIKTCFFRTYPEAAYHAATQTPPLIRMSGLRRVCHDAVNDFQLISPKSWPSTKHKVLRRLELNQAIWKANKLLQSHDLEPVSLMEGDRIWEDGQNVRTPFGVGIVRGFDPINDLYRVDLDWRPLNIQVAEYMVQEKLDKFRARANLDRAKTLATVVELDEVDDDNDEFQNKRSASAQQLTTPQKVLIKKTNSKLKSSKLWDEASTQIAETAKEVSDNYAADPSLDKRFIVSASVQGRLISNYTPPTLPKFDKNRVSLFSFLVVTNENPPATKKIPPSNGFSEGTQCTTPFGPATIVKYRRNDNIVEVDMDSWDARGYLRPCDVKIISKSLLGTFFRRTNEPSKNLEFPHAKGTVIRTPFGEGAVVRPIPVPSQKERLKKDLPRSKGSMKPPPTIGISLTSWRLADHTHPILYCTVETARNWKDSKAIRTHPNAFRSALVNLVSSSKTLLGRLASSSQHRPKPEPKVAPATFEQYFKLGAAVATACGDGVVVGFRPSDGFYELKLKKWVLTSGRHPTAFMSRRSINFKIADGCGEGYPVLTRLGLSGTLASVEPTTGE